jgi:DHA1 family tetracycline resistance protein-like MFS transporter
MSWMFLSAIRRECEFWYIGYAMQAIVVFGTGAILMPILINNHSNNAALAGAVIALFYVGQLLSPIMGSLTDRTGRHHLFYLVGYVLLAIGLGLFPTTSVVWFWMMLAFVQGVGSGTSNTVASMFIVEFKPKRDWDARIGWLQTFYGVGQCLGLVLVSYLEQTPAVGLYVSAALMLPAFILGAIQLPPSRERHRPEQPTFTRRKHKQPRTALAPLAHYEASLAQMVQKVRTEWFSAFGLFILSWFFVMLATWLLGVLFPLLMKQALGVSYQRSSLYYSIAAFIGIFAYAPSGTLGEKIGDGWVVMIGAVMTVASLVGMATLAYVDTGINSYLIAPIYMLIPIAWSPLIVGGSAWAAQLTKGEEGEALGLFNAASAISSVIAAFGGGLLAHQFSYKALLVTAAISSVISVMLLLPLLGQTKCTAHQQEQNASDPSED